MSWSENGSPAQEADRLGRSVPREDVTAPSIPAGILDPVPVDSAHGDGDRPARSPHPATLVRRKSLPNGSLHHKPLAAARLRSKQALGQVAKDAERLLEDYLQTGRPIQAQRLTMSLARALEADLGHWEWSLPQRINRFPALNDQLEHLQIQCQPLLKCLILAGAWADGDLALCCISPLEYLANPVMPDAFSRGMRLMSWLRSYPIQLLAYGIGVAAVTEHRYPTIKRLLHDIIVPAPFGTEPQSLALGLFVHGDLEEEMAGQLPCVPVHGSLLDHLHAVLEQPLREVTGRPALYDRAFDRFALLLACVYADETISAGQPLTWVPQERITGSVLAGSAANPLEAEARRAGDTWPPLQAGMFHGSLNRFLDCLHRVEVLRGNRLDDELDDNP